MADLMNFKYLDHEQKMTNLNQKADLVRELYVLKKITKTRFRKLNSSQARTAGFQKNFAVDYVYLNLN